MNAIASLDNLASWFIQVSLLAFGAVLLPMVLRIRHPKSQLAYYHVVLVMCFAIPFVQPWHYPILLVSNAAPQAPVSTIPWTWLLIGLVLAGALFRFSWLGIGLWQLRRYRRSGIPIYPTPSSIQEAIKQTGAVALFSVSKDVTGPATLGYIDPVVLLPPSFLLLEEEEQHGIACHELVHVRRGDWLVTIAEEIVGALFWFNPAVRWLLSRAKLTREQVVDAEVVRLTGAQPYVQALLSMAVVAGGRRTVPAAPFFTQGHLMSRMQAILRSPNPSFSRLCISYASTALLLVAAGWVVMMWFPFTGEAQIVTTNRDIGPSMVMMPPQARGRVFSLRIPAPTGVAASLPATAVHDVTIPAPRQFESAVLPPPPPPPPPPPDGPATFFRTMGVRFIRPGEKPSPEELERFLHTFPDRSVVQVVQAEDGTIQRIMIQSRRSADAPNSIPFVGPVRDGQQLSSGATDTTKPAVPADGID